MFRRTLSIAAAAALVIAGGLVAQSAAADIRTGNAKTECQSAGYTDGVKLDTGAIGEYNYPDDGPWEPDDVAGLSLWVKIIDSHSFAWVSNSTMAAVLVKAGPTHFVYPGGLAGAGDLLADKGYKQGISHLTFCFGGGDVFSVEKLAVTKTAVTSYDRHHHWSLDKKVSAADVWLYAPHAAGQHEGSVDWTVNVGYKGYTDSGFTVSGEVTVLNIGDAPVAVTSLTDVLTANDAETVIDLDCGDVDLDGGAVIMLPGDSFSCTYSQGLDDRAAGANVATATTLSGDSFASAPAELVWGAPANETDATVTLTDISDIDGAGIPATPFTAPYGGELVYSNTFAWADYEECGNSSYDNTASLTAMDVPPVTKTVNVHVQCETFRGETAWAANAGPGTLPYNKKGGNWATYVAYAGGTTTYKVYAGQTMLAGTATITPVAGGVKVTVELTGAWEFADTASNLKIQNYAKAPSGNPSPGLFAYKTTCTMQSCTSGVIPAANFYGIHMDVGVWVPDPLFGP